MTALAYLSARELAQKLCQRELSSVELLDHLLARIERFDADVNAVVVRDFDRARERARQADQARARGEDWGPLHGLPITVKESFDVPGLPTTWGFEQFRSNLADQPAVAVQRLLDAGAIVMGKTNVPVALSDWQSFNPVYGTTRNPWDLTRTPGGSSGGAAAALATGMTTLELGSDIGASIRNPAHYCGVYGHKPTWGVVPQQGHQLDREAGIDAVDIGVAGPLARHADDLVLSMQLLTTPLQHFGHQGWVDFAWRDSGLAPRQCRVAVIDDDAEAPVDNSIRQALDELVDFLRAQGVQVRRDVRPVESHESHRVYMNLLRAATGAMSDDATYAEYRRQAALLPPDQDDAKSRTYRGGTMSHREWVQWDRRRAALRAQWDRFFLDVDLLITPVATAPAFEHNHQGMRWDRMLQVNGQPQPHTHGLFWAGYPGVVGLPATAVPLGLTASGLPVGAQIIGNAFTDPVGLRFAQWLGREWRGFVPPPGYE